MTANAATILDALGKKFRKGGNPESAILIPEARAGAGYGGNSGQLDLIALPAWKATGAGSVIGVEVKVSRSDWLRELKQPEKSERFMRYCNRFWLAVPQPAGDIVHDDELPDTWGLIAVYDTGTTRVIRPAPKLDPEPPPVSWWVGWMAQVDRRHAASERRALDAEYQRGLTEGRGDSLAQHEADRITRERERAVRDLDQARELLDVMGQAAGIEQFGRHTILDPRQAERIRLTLELSRQYGSVHDLTDRIRGLGHAIEHFTGQHRQLVERLDTAAPTG